MSFVTQFGSKQYIVKEGQKFAVDRLSMEEGSIFDLPVLYDISGSSLRPKVKVVAHVKGKKLRIVKFKSKNKYHKVNGFRPSLTILEVLPLDQDTKTDSVKKSKTITRKKSEKAETKA
jgi:large subunit ribosomal protein L21